MGDFRPLFPQAVIFAAADSKAGLSLLTPMNTAAGTTLSTVGNPRR
jgi:hypothetical protein